MNWPLLAVIWIGSCAVFLILGYELKRVDIKLEAKRLATDASRIAEIKRLARETIEEHLQAGGRLAAAPPAPVAARTPAPATPQGGSSWPNGPRA